MKFDMVMHKSMYELDAMGMGEEQKRYVVAKAWYDTMESEAVEIEAKILSENEFYSDIPECPDLHGLRAKKAYEFVDNEAEYTRFQKLFYEECGRRGLPWEWNRTLSADASEAKKLAEDALLDWLWQELCMASKRPLTRVDFDRLRGHWKHRGVLIDIAMSWGIEGLSVRKGEKNDRG